VFDFVEKGRNVDFTNHTLRDFTNEEDVAHQFSQSTASTRYEQAQKTQLAGCFTAFKI
jgi:hypothetical protein